MKMYPFKLGPIFKQRIWGGQKLREVFDKDISADEKIGESWELSDLPEDKSIILNGELAGRTIGAAISKYPEEITGKASFSGQFPLLIKLLDAEQALSVQVHPDAEACQRMGRGDPKTECWFIVSAKPDSVLYKGFKNPVTKKDFEDAIKNGTANELLETVPVKAGECHFLPAGTAHSIGAGLLIAEIQTPSDTTYRVFDWNRVDANGKSRPLHIEEALESLHFDVCGRDLPVTTIGRLVDCEFFSIDKGHQARSCELFLPEGVMNVLIFLSGSGAIRGGTEGVVDFRSGDCLLIPSDYTGAVCFAADTHYLIVTPRLI
jgi:mannose-6-phosphate isomerase